MPARPVNIRHQASVADDGDDSVARLTDQYFNKTKRIVERFGDRRVTYAVFMRLPVCFAPRLMTEWLARTAARRGVEFEVELNYREGEWVGAGEPLLYINGAMSDLVDLETLYLPLLGPACVAAYNAFEMCAAMPDSGFMAMDARHCAGAEMADMMAYGASVGSNAARAATGAVGFIGNATDATAHHFGNDRGLGTMPHALIGYAGSAVGAAEMFHESFPDDPLTVLVDYHGREITDALAVCERFADLAAAGRFSVGMSYRSTLSPWLSQLTRPPRSMTSLLATSCASRLEDHELYHVSFSLGPQPVATVMANTNTQPVTRETLIR